MQMPFDGVLAWMCAQGYWAHTTESLQFQCEPCKMLPSRAMHILFRHTAVTLAS